MGITAACVVKAQSAGQGCLVGLAKVSAVRLQSACPAPLFHSVPNPAGGPRNLLRVVMPRSRPHTWGRQASR